MRLLMQQSVCASVRANVHLIPDDVTERRALRRLHHVQGFWPTPAEGPQEDSGCTAENE